MKLYLWLAVAVLTGCAVGDKPYVRLRIEGDETFKMEVVKGANAWISLGYVAGVEPAPTGPEMIVSVTAVSEDQLQAISSGDGFLVGVTDIPGGTIKLLNTLSGDKLQHTTAHEIGHALFGPDHLTASKGLMYYQATEFLFPTENDYALVCKESGDCF